MTPSQRELRTKGDATRERLLQAAVALFGHHGFEGTSARNVATAAGTPVSAIPYYFGTMETLYRTVLGHVVESMGKQLGTAVLAAEKGIHGSEEDAAIALAGLTAALIQVIAVSPDAADWAKILMREHLDPSPAFNLVYDGVMLKAHKVLCALIGRSTSRDPTSIQVKIEAFAHLGQVLIFRVAREAVLRTMNWKEIAQEESSQIVGVLNANVSM